MLKQKRNLITYTRVLIIKQISRTMIYTYIHIFFFIICYVIYYINLFRFFSKNNFYFRINMNRFDLSSSCLKLKFFFKKGKLPQLFSDLPACLLSLTVFPHCHNNIIVSCLKGKPWHFFCREEIAVIVQTSLFSTLWI